MTKGVSFGFAKSMLSQSIDNIIGKKEVKSTQIRCADADTDTMSFT